ncbi:dipeptide ABC transporter ATP-binding protein [uncultured Cohaesibacter sp.]|uniref:ABC transporter ATP-binding protein n=1 Tax=uncultured Cohaesibacter sp. TaxID=1002546 RepID=UPI00292FA139|nr:dipeptide ABC transporter ATP-binding protein [uncultured Cohaesibacter sp.]
MNESDPHSSNLIEVENLTVAFGQESVIENLSFSVRSGQTLAIVGESGSGKSVTALSILRLADMSGARYQSGRILFSGKAGQQDLLTLSQKDMRSIRGKEIAMIFQEPMTSLNPVFTVGDQIAEVLQLHEGMSRNDALKEGVKLLKMVRLGDAESIINRYPHQLSGGMRQRVMIAMALACRPKLLIADEPTTALDVTIQAQILAILRDLKESLDMGIIFITHDMAVVAEMADDVVVMRKGHKMEQQPVTDIFKAPQHLYTQTLLSAVPRLGAMNGEDFPKRLPISIYDESGQRTEGEERIQNTAKYGSDPLIGVRDLVVRFNVKKSWIGRPTHRVHAVEKISLDIYPGETLALVGESGSGKSTIGRTIQQLQESQSGTITFKGESLASMSGSERRALRKKIQYIFQDPYASLDPRKTIGFSIAEPIRTHDILHDDAAIKTRVSELLERVGLLAEHANRFPHEFSGGQRQRICIARALASDPELIIADEALSALDVSVQAQIISLFMDLQAERGLSYLFISHDMAVVEQMSHRVAVLYLGQIVEAGSRRQIFEDPQHAYTRNLLASVPVADPGKRVMLAINEAEIPSPIRAVGNEPELLTHSEVKPGHIVANQ